jgi:tetratricopeptide (TPR) repeat protein
LRPSSALWQDRAYYLTQLGEKEAAQSAQKKAESVKPVSARDHYLLAITYMRNGLDNLDTALEELDRAIALNPRHFWSHLQKGICYLEKREHALASGAFGVCIGLWPEFAWGYFDRGYALYRSNKKAEAIDDFTAALLRDPNFLDAYVNRGLVCLERKDYSQALADFQKAADLGKDDASLHTGRGIALEGLGRHREADEAFRMAFTRLDDVLPEARVQILWTYGFAVAARLPEKAREAFAVVLLREPKNPQALYGCGMVLAAQNQLDAALGYFDRLLQIAPQHLEARRGRAILLARRGNFDKATQDINACLSQEPTSGSVLYAAACITALAARKAERDDARKMAADQALNFLQNAFARGYGQDKAAEDPDLDGIRTCPEFQKMLGREQVREK